MNPESISQPQEESNDYDALYEEAQNLVVDVPEGLPGGNSRADFEERINDAVDAAELLTVISRIKDFKARRAGILHTSFTGSTYLLEHPEEFSEVKSAVDAVREYSDNPKNSLGRGNIAEVYLNPNFEHVCAKIIHNMGEYRKQNSVALETGYLEDLAALDVDGVRTPHPYGYIEDINLRGIVMERLRAVSIDHLALGRRSILEPKEVDPQAIMKKIVRYLDAIHDLKIYHGDLHSGNIMISIDPPHHPYIIDFGLAKKVYFSEELRGEPEHDKSFLGEVGSKLRTWRANLDRY